MPSLRIVPLLLLFSAATLAAQGPIAAPPPLPFGLAWTMNEKEAVAALKQHGIEAELEIRGERLTRQQIKRIAREQDLDESTVREAQTWRYYSCGKAIVDSSLPVAWVSIEFLKNRLSEFHCWWECGSSAQHLAAADSLVAHYSRPYSGREVTTWSEMPEFPPGQILAENYAEISMGLPEEARRPELFHGWSGTLNGWLYGTMISTSESRYLDLRIQTGPDRRLGR